MEGTVDNKKTLYLKLAEIMGEIENVQKEGRNQRFGYRFVTSETVLSMLRKKLADKKLCLWITMVDMRQEPKSDSKMKTTFVKFEFTLCCGDTGATLSATWESEAEDTNDKGINKAATAAEKYWLMKTFMISTGDPEADDADADFNGEGQQPTTKSKSTKKQPEPTIERPYTPEILLDRFGKGLARARQTEESGDTDPDYMEVVKLTATALGGDLEKAKAFVLSISNLSDVETITKAHASVFRSMLKGDTGIIGKEIEGYMNFIAKAAKPKTEQTI